MRRAPLTIKRPDAAQVMHEIVSRHTAMPPEIRPQPGRWAAGTVRAQEWLSPARVPRPASPIFHTACSRHPPSSAHSQHSSSSSPPSVHDDTPIFKWYKVETWGSFMGSPSQLQVLENTLANRSGVYVNSTVLRRRALDAVMLWARLTALYLWTSWCGMPCHQAIKLYVSFVCV